MNVNLSITDKQVGLLKLALMILENKTRLYYVEHNYDKDPSSKLEVEAYLKDIQILSEYLNSLNKDN